MSPASYQTAPPRDGSPSIAPDRDNGHVRLGVETALVGGVLVRGDVEVLDGASRVWGSPDKAGEPRSLGSSTCR